jgi:hypothetical protein
MRVAVGVSMTRTISNSVLRGQQFPVAATEQHRDLVDLDFVELTFGQWTPVRRPGRR